MKRAIIVGADGQDGQLLTQALDRRGREVIGIGRDSVRGAGESESLRIDVTRPDQVLEACRRWSPAEVYYLPAVHHSSEDRVSTSPPELFRKSYEVHVDGLLNFLEGIRLSSLQTRLFYAGSCLIFGETTTRTQNEATPFNPQCIYGITKTAGIHCCRYFRRTHGLFAATGILYNHESAYRDEGFVSRKIISGAVRIWRGEQHDLVLGNLSAEIDWGYAPDYVGAMERILALEVPDDFIIATGELHSVQEFVEIAFESLGLDWRDHVREDPSLITRQRHRQVGDASKLRARTGWRPSVQFREMVEVLVREERDAP